MKVTTLKKNWPVVLGAAGALMAILAEVQKYLETDKTPTWQEMAAAAGFALLMYVTKRPGDLTKEEAAEHARKAVRESQLPELAEHQ
jgi:hypothetical protein